MNDTSRSGTLRLPARGRRTLAALSLLLTSTWLALVVSARRCEAQSLDRPGQIDLLNVQSSVDRFYQTRAELEQYKERERLNVPGCVSDLSKVVAEFQKHIVDMHFRHVTCKVCKDQVKRIRQLVKSIEGAMK